MVHRNRFLVAVSTAPLVWLLLPVVISGVDEIAGPVVPLGGIGSGETNATKTETMAERMEDLVKQEFKEDVEEAEYKKGKTFNETAQKSDATLETVVKVTHKQNKEANITDFSPDGSLGAGTISEGAGSNSTDLANNGDIDVDRIIDSQDNEFVLSKPKELAALTLDPMLIRDLTILITAAAAVGMLFEATGQPVINGYLIAGALVGPGGLMLIKELVQVESLAQLGVQFLLFYLGMEFSISKMRSVGGVALIGGLVEALLFVAISALLAFFMGAALTQGILLGAFVSLSSTSVVVKCLEASRTATSQYGQITIGTLILQDCTVGIMFAAMPILARHSAEEVQTIWAIVQVSGKLLLLVAVAAILAKTTLPFVVRVLARNASQDLFQIVLIALCLVSAWTTGWLGLSQELGAFIAGAMLSASDHHELALKSVDGARNVFTTLFITSIGLVMSPLFLWEHLWFLALGLLAVFVFKIAVITAVVYAFKFSFRTALLVGLSLAQISEFAFVLLSMAMDMDVIRQETYLMLIGVTALSLLITPGIVSLGQKWLLRDTAPPEEQEGVLEPLHDDEWVSELGLADGEESPVTSSRTQTIQRRNKAGSNHHTV